MLVSNGSWIPRSYKTWAGFWTGMKSLYTHTQGVASISFKGVKVQKILAQQTQICQLAIIYNARHPVYDY